MPTLRRFWSALEAFPGLAAPAAEWRAHLGPEWASSQALLRVTGERAEAMLLKGEPHRVVVHDRGRIVAIPDDGGVATQVRDEDVAILQADARQVEQLTADALGIEPSRGNAVSSIRRCAGRRKFTDTTACDVYLFMHCEPAAIGASIFKLLAGCDEPLVILTPCRIEDDDLRQIVRLRNCLLLALEDAVDIGNDLSAVITPEARRSLDQFSRVVHRWESGDAPSDPYRFQRVGRVWVIAFEGRRCYIPQSEASGLAYLQHLIARPGKVIGVAQLEQMVQGGLPLDTLSIGDEVVDRAALQEYEEEYRRLAGQLARAREHNDDGEESRLITEMAKLLSAINASTGLNGRIRRSGDDVERLRTKVTKSLDRAIGALRSERSPLVEHLESSLSTGRNMAYCPVRELAWAFS